MISFSIDPVGTSNDAMTKLFKKKKCNEDEKEVFQKVLDLILASGKRPVLSHWITFDRWVRHAWSGVVS